MSELKIAESELKKLTEKRERGEPVDKDDFARADKAVDRADKAVENARADVQRAHEIYTKLLPGANGACSCMCGRCLCEFAALICSLSQRPLSKRSHKLHPSTSRMQWHYATTL